MNLTELATLHGVKLSKPDANLLAKLDSYGIVLSDNPTATLTVTNPISGYSAEVPRLVGCLVNLTYKLMQSYERSPSYQMTFNGHKVAIQTYDRVKMLVLKLDPKVYSNFID
jgi:hypothetical protein